MEVPGFWLDALSRREALSTSRESAMTIQLQHLHPDSAGFLQMLESEDHRHAPARQDGDDEAYPLASSVMIGPKPSQRSPSNFII
jgi:hypothetical protein